jgi:hypothetical protein
LILGFVFVAGVLHGADTDRLAAHFQRFRGKLTLSPDEYRGMQEEMLRWLDARIKAGEASPRINAKLKAAGLFSPDEDGYKSHAGYVEEIRERQVPRARDLRILLMRIYKGSGCYLDDTVVLYGKASGAQVGWFSADSTGSEFARYLNGLEIGARDANGSRLIASGWNTSNCSSSWNEKVIRIDRLTRAGVENLLSKGVDAKDADEPWESVSASTQLNTATFRYNGATGESAMLSASSIARYRIEGDRVIREAPLAINRIGFLHEWLRLDEANVGRWSTTEATAIHAGVAKAFADHVFGWQRIAKCPGDPPVWELSVTLDDPRRLYVFRMNAERATELRMLSVTAKESSGCRVIEWQADLGSVGRELPW